MEFLTTLFGWVGFLTLYMGVVLLIALVVGANERGRD